MASFIFPRCRREPMCFRSAVWDTALSLSPFSSRQQTRARNSCSPLLQITSEQVGVYVDDVLVPNLLHSVANVSDAPTLSLLTGNDVEELLLMPVAYPVRYADDTRAALP